MTPDALRRLRLWDEQGPSHARACPYAGTVISFEMAVSAITEIDHILPFSRTVDNSMSNMIVCTAGANRAKGNRTPYEAFGHSPPGFPDNKSWRFQPDAMEKFEANRGFLDRQRPRQIAAQLARPKMQFSRWEIGGQPQQQRRQCSWVRRQPAFTV